MQADRTEMNDLAARQPNRVREMAAKYKAWAERVARDNWGQMGRLAAEFVFLGNSVRSDVLPLLEIGSTGVHVPYHVTWEHEVVRDHGRTFTELATIDQLPGWLAETA